MYTLIRDGFWKDLIVVILVSILVGSLFVTGVSYASNAFLGKTVSGLAGESGEYDIIVHTKLDMADDAESVLLGMAKGFEGMQIVRTVNLLARANFFVSLGTEKTNQNVVNFLSGMSQVPGYSGSTIIMEPRLTISGVADRTYQIIKDEICQLDGVDFVFKFGNDIQIICISTESIGEVEKGLSEILDRYHVAEVKFKEGAGDDVLDKGELENRIKAALDVNSNEISVYNIPINSSKQNAAQMLKVMTQMRDLLEGWKTSVEITGISNQDKGLTIGSRLVLSSSDLEGQRPEDDDIVVEVTEVKEGRCFADVVSGDTGHLSVPVELYAYVLNGEKAGKRSGTAVVNNPRTASRAAVDDVKNLALNAETTMKGIIDSVQSSIDAAGFYEIALDSLVTLQRALEGMGITSDSAELNLNPENVEYLAGIMETVCNALDKLEKLASGVSFFTNTYDALLDNIGTLKDTIKGFSQKVDSVLTSVQNGGEFADFLSDIVTVAEVIMVKMNELDPIAMKESLNEMQERMSSMPIEEFSGMANELETLKSSLPSFSDAEISEAVSLLETYMENESFEEKAQFLIKYEQNEDVESLNRSIQTALEDVAESAYVMDVGIVQSGVRGEVDKLLSNVKSLVASMMTAIFVLYVMLFDHAQLMAFSVSRITYDLKRKWVQLACYAFATALSITFGIFAIVQKSVGGLNSLYFLLIGAVVALITIMCCRNFAKIDVDEIEACYAFGVRETDTVREVVIPSGKPGLLGLINRGRLKFPLNRHFRSDEVNDVSILDRNGSDFSC